MTQEKRSTSVLIVGAGPVGLALANELGWRGVSYLLVDEGQGDVLFPAGEGIFSRTMEHLRRWGIAKEVRHNKGFPDNYPLNVCFATSLHGKPLAIFDAPSNGEMPKVPDSPSPEGILICPKQVFDPMLRKNAEAQGGELLYKTRLVGFDKHSDGVIAHVCNVSNGQEYEIQAKYLAACDGARSGVRKQLGIPYVGTFGEGHNFAVFFKAPDLLPHIEAQFGRKVFQLHTVNTPHRPYFTAVDGHSLWRMSMYIEKGDDPDPSEALRHSLGEDIAFEIIRAQPWSGHRVVAERYRDGPVFLLGDAAQLRWPKGGFGANTGIGDAADLGWKISAVLEGWGGSKLLDSYESERRPIAIRNVNEAANNRALDKLIQPNLQLDQDTESGDTLRQSVGNQIHAMRLREFRTQGVQLGYRYRSSPICINDGSLEPPDDHMIYQPSTWPGSRAPHAWLPDGSSLIDCYGRGFVLVRFNREEGLSTLAKAADELDIPFQELFIDSPSIVTLYEKAFVLVRPDGHVAWRSDNLPTFKEALDILRHVIGD